MSWTGAWSGTKKRVETLRKTLLTLALVLAVAAGCVSIDDPNVHVTRPGEIDPYRRNVLDKCPPHTYPHRLIVAQAGNGSILTRQGQSAATKQEEFDLYWGSVTPILDPNSTTNTSAKPIVNFERETALFVPLPPENSCQKFKPLGDEMTTDCYTITIPILWYREGQDCQSVSAIPVFLYIYPKTDWPVSVRMLQATPTPTATSSVVLTPTPTVTATPTPEEEEE
jgi:hypothetical protein